MRFPLDSILYLRNTTLTRLVLLWVHQICTSTTILVSEEKAVDKVEEKEEQIEPPPIPIFSNDKEVCTETHSLVTIPLETHHETQVSFLQCLMVLSYAIIFKDLW
jgi:hypothetical protein